MYKYKICTTIIVIFINIFYTIFTHFHTFSPTSLFFSFVVLCAVAAEMPSGYRREICQYRRGKPVRMTSDPQPS